MAVLVNPTTGALGKKTSRSVLEDGSQIVAAKWSTYEDFDEAGVEMATATIQQAVDGLIFQVNGGNDTGISAYDGSSTGSKVTYGDTNADTVQKVLDIINGIGVGQPTALETGYMIRWRAGLGDYRPGHPLDATSGLVVAAATAALGQHDEGMVINADSSGLPVASIYSVGLGSALARSGGGQVYADHFESDYATNTSGTRFRVRAQRRRREEQPGLSEFSVSLTEVRADMAFASDAKVVSIFDIDDNLLAQFPIGAGTLVEAITEATPFVGPSGSPLFVECVGVGALTDGPLTVTGDIRIA